MLCSPEFLHAPGRSMSCRISRPADNEVVQCREHGAHGHAVLYHMGRGIAQEDIPGLGEGLEEGSALLGGDRGPVAPGLGGSGFGAAGAAEAALKQ